MDGRMWKSISEPSGRTDVSMKLLKDITKPKQLPSNSWSHMCPGGAPADEVEDEEEDQSDSGVNQDLVD